MPETVKTEVDARLGAAAPDLLRELEETAAWLDERADVIERAKPVRKGGESVVRVEACRLRGRAALIRTVALKAKGGPP